MTKKLLLTITCLTISTTLSISPVLAAPLPTVADATPSTSIPSKESLNEKLNKQINELKERIASRVAELNLVEKRGIIGTISEKSDNKISLTDMTGKTRIVDVDEITKFSSPSSKSSFGISDLTKGTKISVLGLYNKQSKQTLARFIDTFVTPVFLSGRIADIDKKNFTITVISENQKETVVDVETITTISIYFKEDGISKYGFSKLKIGDRVMATGFPNKKDPAILVPSRILVLPELPKNPRIIVPEDTTERTPSQPPTHDTTTSSGSGKKQPSPIQ